MSPVASRIEAAVVGNTARALSGHLPGLDFRGAPANRAEQTPARPRTPLSLVVNTPRRSGTPVMVTLFLLLVAALAAVLIMSVSVSQGQYDLVTLKNQQRELQLSNQSLEQDLGAREAPQNLVARAAAMGMVPGGTTGQIDVRTKKVSGNPQPAKADAKALVAIPPATIDAPAPAVAADVPADAGGPAALDGVPQAKKNAAKAAQKPASRPAPKVPSPDLNGGTIPAPAQKTS
ncbi:hypothetical protein [Specibacter sp. RAF43]|uniref:hypothetical protein n=1 Tax=Specibacter sp. RAF43 TaxID=3233057 RepID=UPI003F9ADCAF